MRTLVTLVCLIFLLHDVNSQRERTLTWYFGENAGLKFIPGLQSVNGGSINTVEGCASISDSCGNFLFYTDGITVYNKNHQVMQGGTVLTGGPSSSQSALIIPNPGNDSIYYVFTTGNSLQTSSPGLWAYSTVNIKHNGGLGAVVKKNDTLGFTNTEKQAAVNHCNGKDVWVMSRRMLPPMITWHSWLPAQESAQQQSFRPPVL